MGAIATAAVIGGAIGLVTSGGDIGAALKGAAFGGLGGAAFGAMGAGVEGAVAGAEGTVAVDFNALNETAGFAGSGVLGDAAATGLGTLGSSVNSALDAFGPGGLGSAADAGTAAIASASGNAGALSAFAPSTAAGLGGIESVASITQQLTDALNKVYPGAGDTLAKPIQSAAINAATDVARGKDINLGSIAKSLALQTGLGSLNTGATDFLKSTGMSDKAASTVSGLGTTAARQLATGRPLDLTSLALNTGADAIGVNSSAVPQEVKSAVQGILSGRSPESVLTSGVMNYVTGKTAEEIAKDTGVDIGTATKLLNIGKGAATGANPARLAQSIYGLLPIGDGLPSARRAP